jgi:hypothetical protein
MQLNLASEEEPVVRKKSNTRNLKIALGLAAVILIPTIGSTLAGSITVGASNTVEFGQGVIATAACDTAIDVVPASVLTEGVFNLSTITVSGVATGCDGKFLTLKVLNSSNTAQIISTGANTTLCKITFDKDAPFTATVADTCGTLSAAGAATFTLTPSGTLAASNVDKITLESSSS